MVLVPLGLVSTWSGMADGTDIDTGGVELHQRAVCVDFTNEFVKAVVRQLGNTIFIR